MKPPPLLQSDSSRRGVESRGRPSCSVLSLENRILAQASSVLSQPLSAAPSLSVSSCPALQPSCLSSTQLKKDLFLFPSIPLCSPQSTAPPDGGLSATGLSVGGVSASRASAGGRSPEGLPAGGRSPEGLPAGGRSSEGLPTGGRSSEGLPAGGRSDGRLLCGDLADGPSAGGPSLTIVKRKSKQMSLCFPEDVQSCDKGLTQEGLLEMDQVPLSEEPVPELRVTEEEEKKWNVELGEEFAMPETDVSEEAEVLKGKKYKLLNKVCCSLVNKSCSPGQEGWDENKSVWRKIKSLTEEISCRDPEFLLKVAVYTRQELKNRLMACFLLALAAHLPETKPHLRRYFCAAVQLPSDWLQVVKIYSTCFRSSLPTCLKKSLVDKFEQFSEAQLARYCTRRGRKRGAKLQKDQTEFTMQKLIKCLHIKKPAELVMSLLGKKYPADVKAFERSGLSGDWQSDRAGQRMKLKHPDTWRTTLSREGNTAATWEKMIDRNSLPFGVMLKNLRNMITQGISAKHHHKVLKRLISESAVIQSKLLPFSFLSAYKAIMQLNRFVDPAVKPDSSKAVLQGIMTRLRKRKRFQNVDWTSAGRRKLRAQFREPFIYRLYHIKRRLLQRARQRRFSEELLERYLQALLQAVEISCRYNIPLLPGRTLICIVETFYGMGWEQAGEVFLPPDPSENVEKTQADPIESPEKTLPDPIEGAEKGAEKTLPDPIEGAGETIPDPIESPEKTLPDPIENADKDLLDPSENTEESLPPPSEDNELTRPAIEAAFLLAMMLSSSCEHSQVLTVSYHGFAEVEVKSDSLIENVRHGIKQLKKLWNDDSCERTSFCNYFSKLTEEKVQVDNIIVLSDSYLEVYLESQVDKYRKNSCSDTFVVNMLLDPDIFSQDHSDKDPHTVHLYGFSKQILKFVSERGSTRLLDHVENIDKLYNIPPSPELGNNPERRGGIVALPATPKLRWREVRVVISSSLRDMCVERDILVRSVFPELRRRVAPHCLYLQEVEMRSGLSEEESIRAVELSLTEVGRSQLLFGMLGEKYGPVVPWSALNSLPQNSWLNSAHSGMSITEMEIRHFQSLYPDSAQKRMFFYFRSPDVVSSIPVAWKADFTAESRESAAKMDELKNWIRKKQFRARENYPCEWGGVVDGQPCVKGLEEFAKAVTEDLWAALQELFLEEVNDTDMTLEMDKQENHQEAQRRHFHCRGKLLSMAIEKVKECQQKGGMLLVEGHPGEGKTAFLAAMAGALLSPDQNTAPVCEVISYSTAASQSAGNISQLLRCLVQKLRKLKDHEEALETPSMSYRALLSEFHLRMSELREGPPLALLVDGVDLVHDAEGQVVSEWILEHLPKGVCLVLSVTTDSVLHVALSKKKRCVLFPLGELTWTDCREMVLKELGVHGKELRDPAFSNQLQMLLMKKKGVISPLYLQLACEELRNLSSFQEVKDSLQALPQSLSELVKLSLLRLQSQFEAAGLDWTLAALTVSSTGLRERDLYPLLNLSTDLSPTHHLPSWQETLELARKPKSQVPMAVFYQLAQNLRCLLRPSSAHTPDEPLTLTNQDVRTAFQQLYISTEEARIRAHLILAAHLWIRSDPHGNHTFIHCDQDALTHLLNHLMTCGQWEPVRFLLSSYYFLYANVRHGLLRPLLENFALFGDSTGDLQQCADFLKRHAPLLSDWPALFVQQALNEAEGSPAHVWAQRMIQQGGVRALKRLNSTEHAPKRAGKLVSNLLWAPSCVAVSPGGRFVAVGTEKGTVHVFLTETSKEVKSLVSSCDGISGCAFLMETVICIIPYSGPVELWNILSGSSTSRLKAHSSRITGCDVSSDGGHLATVSLDFTLKVWRNPALSEVTSLLQPSPPNCVSFDPAGRLVGVGCWDGAVRVWDWERRQNHVTLSGHQSSVLCLLFSPSSSSLLCSGSSDGEVRLWSVPAVSCIWHCRAHCSSVTAVSFLSDGKTPLSAGRDGTVRRRGLFYCYSGGIRALARGRDGRLYSVSDDRSLRAWSITTEGSTREMVSLSAACFLEKGELLACGFSSGRLELWRHNSLIYSNKVNDSCIRALTGMPDKQLAVGCSDCSVTVWKLELDSQSSTAELSKVMSYTLIFPVAYLLYNNILVNILAVCSPFTPDISSATTNDITYAQYSLKDSTQPLGIVKNDEKSMWILGEDECELLLRFTFSVFSGQRWRYAFGDVKLDMKEQSEEACVEKCEEQSEEASKETCEEWCEEMCEEQSEETPEEACEEPHKETCEVPSEEECGEQSKETCEELYEETWEELSKEECGEQSKKASEEPHDETCEEPSKEECGEQSEVASEEPHEETCEEPSKEECGEQSEVACEEPHEEPSEEHDEEFKPRKTCLSAAAMHKGFIVCGDARGCMWTNQAPNMATWSEKRQAHSDHISVLRLTDRAIISASYDGTVKLWDRNTKKQVGLFVCGAPVEILEVNEDNPSQLVCGDASGQVYFLSWTG